MKGNIVPRIEKILFIDGFSIICLWNTNEVRVINFKNLFKEWKIKEGDIDYQLTDLAVFSKLKLNDSKTLAWDEIKIDEKPYDIDPLTLYNASELTHAEYDTTAKLYIKIKIARLMAGLSQEELASRIGTTKQYLSRLENGKSDIQVETLTRIVEQGLGKKLTIKIE